MSDKPSDPPKTEVFRRNAQHEVSLVEGSAAAVSRTGHAGQGDARVVRDTRLKLPEEDRALRDNRVRINPGSTLRRAATLQPQPQAAARRPSAAGAAAEGQSASEGGLSAALKARLERVRQNNQENASALDALKRNPLDPVTERKP